MSVHVLRYFFSMDIEFFKVFGQIAGIGGISLGVFLILFREVIKKKIFPYLKKDDAFTLLKTLIFLVWSIAILGIMAWVYIVTREKPSPQTSISATQVSRGDQSPNIFISDTGSEYQKQTVHHHVEQSSTGNQSPNMVVDK